MDVIYKGRYCFIILTVFIQLHTTYVFAQGGDGTIFDRQRCPNWPHLRARVRHGSDPSAAMHCITAEEARLLREATRGMGGGGTSMGSSSGMSSMPMPSFPQSGIGSSPGLLSQGMPGSGVPGLFPGLESGTGAGASLTFPGSDSMRSGSGSMQPGFQSGVMMRPGFQGSDPSRQTFPGASVIPGASSTFDASRSGSPNSFSPEMRLGGSPAGLGDSGLMGARPLGTPPRFPGSFAGGPGGMSGSAGGVGTFTPGSGTPPTGTGMRVPVGGPAGVGDTEPRAIGEASLIMSDSRGIYFNFFAYTGSTPIRVGIDKTGFCPMPVRTPSAGPPVCEQECSSDNECTPRGATHKCCPVGRCSLGCVDPRTGTPGP